MIPAPAGGSRRPGLAVVGFALLVVLGLQFDNFLTTGNLTATSLNSADVLMASIGTMALLVSGNVDLSIGSQYALTSVASAWLAVHTHHAVLAIGLGIVLGAVLGLVNGLLTIALDISPLIVTLATLAVYRGAAYVIGSGDSIYGLPAAFTRVGQSRLLGVPVPVAVALVVFLVGGVLLVMSVAGLRLHAIGGNATAAARAGVPVARLVVATFALNGAVVGTAGVLAAARLGSGSPTIAVGFEVSVLTAVILGGVAFTGGVGHPLGVFVGVATLGIVNAGLLFHGYRDWWQQITLGVLLLVALAADQVLLAYRAARQSPDEPLPPRASEEPDGPVLGDREAPSHGLLEVRDVSFRYGRTAVLEGIDLTVAAGEVVCLVGDNGAGKSTLVRVIAGSLQPNSGQVLVDGVGLPPGSAQARRAGVETVFQDLALCPNLGVTDNIVLGAEPRLGGPGLRLFRDHRTAQDQARQRLARLGAAMPQDGRPVEALSGGQRQAVAIARVLHDTVRLFVLDEPTSALGVRQTAEVLRLVRALAASGRGVLLVTHDVEDTFDVADRVVVLDRGRVIHDGRVEDLTKLELLGLMSGRRREPRLS